MEKDNEKGDVIDPETQTLQTKPDGKARESPNFT
jgi:hypothetical protein